MTRYAIRFAVEKDKPVERPMYVSPKRRRDRRRGYVAIEKNFTETPETTFANRETAEKWVEAMTFLDAGGYKVYYGYVIEEIEEIEEPEPAKVEPQTYVPIPDDEAASLLGEGIHTGLRKGTDAANSSATWNAIAAEDSGWSDALGFALWGLQQMGYAVCKKEEPK